MEKLGKAYKEATGLLEIYYEAFFEETRLAGEDRMQSTVDEELGVASLEKDLLQKKIAQPLSEFFIKHKGAALQCRRLLRDPIWQNQDVHGHCFIMLSTGYRRACMHAF